MPPLAVLGTLGTILATTSMLPHLAHAIRTRQPSGSPHAWLLGALTGGIWLSYGLTAGDLLIAAPNLVTIPVNTILGVWCLLSARAKRTAAAEAAREIEQLEALYAAKAAHPAAQDRPLFALA